MNVFLVSQSTLCGLPETSTMFVKSPAHGARKPVIYVLLRRYGYAAVVELLLKRGADPNSKDVEDKTPGDVIGNDLTEDSSMIVHNLLKEHAEKVKANRQRRGSCPAIPRTAMMTAVNASNGAINAASPMSPISLRKHSALLPLPNVLVAKTDLVETSPDRGGISTVGDVGELDQPIRHKSFSVAAHIRVRFTALCHVISVRCACMTSFAVCFWKFSMQTRDETSIFYACGMH